MLGDVGSAISWQSRTLKFEKALGALKLSGRVTSRGRGEETEGDHGPCLTSAGLQFRQVNRWGLCLDLAPFDLPVALSRHSFHLSLSPEFRLPLSGKTQRDLPVFIQIILMKMITHFLALSMSIRCCSNCLAALSACLSYCARSFRELDMRNGGVTAPSTETSVPASGDMLRARHILRHTS